jgi:hypothetical protein
VLAEKGDVGDEDTVWIGAMSRQTGDDLPHIRAMEAIEDRLRSSPRR